MNQIFIQSREITII